MVFLTWSTRPDSKGPRALYSGVPKVSQFCKQYAKYLCASSHRDKNKVSLHFQILFVPREIGRRRRRRPISLGTASIFEMAREDATPYFGPVLRGTKGFFNFRKKMRHLCPLTVRMNESTVFHQIGCLPNQLPKTCKIRVRRGAGSVTPSVTPCQPPAALEFCNF